MFQFGGGLEFCLGAKPPKSPRGDGTDFKQWRTSDFPRLGRNSFRRSNLTRSWQHKTKETLQSDALLGII